LSAKLGGGRTYLNQLLTRLPKDVNLDIRIFCPANLPLPSDSRLKREHTKWPTHNPLLRAIWEKIMLPRYLKQVGADVLFCPGGVVATKAPVGVRVATMFRNMIPFDDALVSEMPWGLMRLRNVILKVVMLNSMSRADLTIFISEFARGVIEAKRKIPNAVTIPHGINERFRNSTRKMARPQSAPTGPYILYVSRFDVYKHHENVVDAYAALPLALRQKYKLVFLGETNLPHFEVIKGRIAMNKLEDSVVIGGAVAHDTLPSWYAHADVIVFASSCENCPNILLESLGAGRPVICSDVMPMPEFGGPDLCYFSPFDARSITQALLEVFSSPERAAAIAEAAQHRSHIYDWDTTANRTWDNILSLVGAHQKN
jgi:glycosyltransferase involved in cell wall biosynthesis